MEFAVCVPLLAVLLFGIIQYGFIFSAYMTLRHAASVTARTISLAGADTSSSNVTALARAAITPALNPNNLQSAAMTATNMNGVDAYSVTLTYSQPLIIRFVVPGQSSGNLQLTTQATYRRNG